MEKVAEASVEDLSKIKGIGKVKAQKMIEEAEGYALERVNHSKGETTRFNVLFNQYRFAKEVTRQRLYLETMSKILPLVGKKLIVDDSVEGLIPLLDLKKEVLDEK